MADSQSPQAIDSRYKKLLQGFVILVVSMGVLFAIIWIPKRQVAPWRNILENYKGSPQKLATTEYLKLENDARKLENDARTTLVQAFGGLALLIGLLFTWRNVRATERISQETLRISQETLRISQQGQITERFTKATNQLGETGPAKLAVRLGGIYALERIARDSERDHWPIMEILTAYVREHAPSLPKDIPPFADDLSLMEKSPEVKNQLRLKPMPDIQAILTVLGRRTRIYRKEECLNLANTDLRGADLRKAQLQGAYLRGAQLQRADLDGAQLEGARNVTVRN
jgi:hypothetical protein